MPARDFATVMKEWPSVKPTPFTRTSTNHLEVARQFKHYEKRLHGSCTGPVWWFKNL